MPDRQKQRESLSAASIHEGKISSLPATYIKALSAIQEQSFIDSEAEDYGLYDKLFTNAHKVAFFRVGFLSGIFDTVFLILGYILYELAKYRVLFPFGHAELSLIDKITLWIIHFAPFMVTLFLTLQTFSYLTGTIPRKMAKFLLAGFFGGSFFTGIILMILGYWSGIEYAERIYNFLAVISEKAADLYWYYLRVIFDNGTWREMELVVFVNVLLVLCYIVQVRRIEKQKQSYILEDEV